MNPGLFRAVMGRFATGVTVITFVADGKPAGMTANAFMSVSMLPPLVMTSVRNESRVNHFLHQGLRFGINVLAETQLNLCAHFAGKPNPALDVPFVMQGGIPLLSGSLAHLGVRVVDVYAAGDHHLYVSAVEYVRLGEQRKPLVFFSGGFRQVQAHTPVINWAGAADCC
jgi:flavin reductase (DIM6/NTAB) family NADH-FMN oxidoreductase RutF